MMTPAKPERQHEWLQRMIGRWSFSSEAEMGPGQPPSKSTGTEVVRSLGGLWVIAEGEGLMGDCGPATMVMTLGYDGDRQRFVGSWIGSMMTRLWVYDGSLDAAERVLTLEAEGPSFAGDGTLSQYRDVITLDGPDHRILTSGVKGADGGWTDFMTAHYHRIG